MKRPAFQFYPADWRKDPALSTCLLAARGLWIELICVAHESSEYGVLSINDRPMTVQQIARTVGETPTIVNKLLNELEQAGVFSRNAAGSIYSRRMVKDERLRNVRAEAGKLGGNPHLLKPKSIRKTSLLKQKSTQTAADCQPHPNHITEQIRTPSSSSSTTYSVPNGTDANASSRAPPDMTKDELWTAGKSLLLQAGLPAAQCGSLLGKLCKDYGDAVVIEAVRTAIVQRPADPASFLVAICQQRASRCGQPNRQEALEARNRDIAAHLAAELTGAGT